MRRAHLPNLSFVSPLAPAGDALREMLPSGPTLILMDELLNCVSRGRKSGMRDQLFNFFQNLSEEARARNNMVLCVSIPSKLTVASRGRKARSP